MTKIESQNTLVNHNRKAIFRFLTNFNHFKNLMPPKISNWQNTDTSCYFTVSGMASLGMRIESVSEFNHIHLVDDGKVPFHFTFDIYLEEVSDNETNVKLLINAKLNPMMKMVVVKPLTRFLEELIDELKKMDLSVYA